MPGVLSDHDTIVGGHESRTSEWDPAEKTRIKCSIREEADGDGGKTRVVVDRAERSRFEIRTKEVERGMERVVEQWWKVTETRTRTMKFSSDGLEAMRMSELVTRTEEKQGKERIWFRPCRPVMVKRSDCSCGQDPCRPSCAFFIIRNKLA